MIKRSFIAAAAAAVSLVAGARTAGANCAGSTAGAAPGAASGACFAPPPPERGCFAPRPVCDADMKVAKIAWKYFENNYQPATGLVNAANRYPSTTEWDAASSLAGTIAARELQIISDKEFDDRVTPFLSTLLSQALFKGIAPNKAYNTQTGAMSDYNNQPSEGIGYSALDLARLASWLNTLACLYPRHAHAAKRALERWKFPQIVHDGQMYGMIVDAASKKEMAVQEGRLGYEQYGGKVFAMLGFNQDVAARYDNEFASSVTILGVPIAYDMRDPRKLGAYNYVVTESYALDAMEFGVDAANAPLVRSIFEVQRRRWQKTGIVTAVSEDNIDRAPYFLYNTIFAAGSPWNTITDSGADHNALKTISTKAAFSLAVLFPGDPYSSVLLDKIASAYDPEKGWYSGIYESGIGYNKAVTANTNGIILQAILYKKYGPLSALCARCGRSIRLAAQTGASCGSACDTARSPRAVGLASAVGRASLTATRPARPAAPANSAAVVGASARPEGASPSKISVGGSVYLEQKLSGPASLGTRLSFSPWSSLFARVGVAQQINGSSDGPSYSWGIGYDDWRPGTFSAQINDWGPRPFTEAPQIRTAALDVGYKLPLPKLVQDFVASGVTVNIPFNGDPGLVTTLTLKPYGGWFVLGGVRFAPFIEDHFSWFYGFGLANSSPASVSLAYWNWGPNKAFTPNFVKNGAVTMSVSWAYDREIGRKTPPRARPIQDSRSRPL